MADMVLGLDVGTTGVKAAAFGLGSPRRHVAIREYPLLTTAPGEAVQDPGVVLAACREALRACAAEVAGDEVVAVSVSAAMHGLLALDDRQRPLTPLLTWADARAAGEAQSLLRSGRAAALAAATGTPVHPMTPLAKLRWFARHDAATWAAARWWIGLKELVLLWLTGELVTELSSASGTGLLDRSTRTWSTEAMAWCGIDPDRLPPILPTTACRTLSAAAAGEVGLPAGTPVAVGAADGPLGNAGTGALDPGVAGLSVGTSGAIRLATDDPPAELGGALFCYALTDRTWVVGGAVSNAGSVMRWAAPALAAGPGGPDGAGPSGGHATDAVLEEAAAVPAGSDGLVMLPYLLPERAPLWDPHLAGAYLGLRPTHTRAHLARAAVEGVCLQLRAVLDRLDAVLPVDTVRATGGALRSALWRDTLAATLGRPVHVVAEAEGTALGAAALGLVALGRSPTLGEAVAQLSGGTGEPPAAIVPDAQAVATYERLNASVPGLIGALGHAAAVIAADRPTPT
jgi:gluconokinase